MPELCANCARHCTQRIQTLSHGLWCSDCLHRHFIACDDCGCSIHTGIDFYETAQESSKKYCLECYNSHSIICSSCSSILANPDNYFAPDGDRLCYNCYSSSCVTCSECDLSIWITDSHTSENLCLECLSVLKWPDRGFFSESPTYHKIGSYRKFGVELESSSCPNHNTIRDDTIFACVYEGSVEGLEFISPVLYGDEGLKEVENICNHANKLDWKIDSSCGYHAHFDLSEESQENCFKVAQAYHYTYQFWNSFISKSRQDNYYCAKHTFDPLSFTEYENFSSWVEDVHGGHRYYWLNWNSYHKYQTVELRNHAGTFNFEKISNWIKAHTRFIDRIIELSEFEISQKLEGISVYDQFLSISDWWSDNSLSEFYLDRAKYFHKSIKRTTILEPV